MIEYLRAEYLNSASRLVRILKNGERRVTKKSVKERHPPVKNDLADLVKAHPEVLEEYKKIARNDGPLDDEELYAPKDGLRDRDGVNSLHPLLDGVATDKALLDDNATVCNGQFSCELRYCRSNQLRKS
jgi:hypothetical protein